MEKNINIDSLTFLLGAGVSIHCEIPTGTKLVAEIAKKIKHKKLQSFFSDVRKCYLDTNHSEPDFEDFLVFLDVMHQSQTKVLLSYLEKKNQFDTAETIKLSRELKFFFIEELRTICMNFSLEKAKKQYENFFDLSDKVYLKIFTTNYDHIIEEVLDNLGFENYSTNFNAIQKGKKLVFHWDSSCKALMNADIQILKIHGSILWYKDKETGIIEEMQTLAKLSSERNPVDNVMITPTVFKDVYQPPYYTLYDRFNQTVKESEIVVIIGHSLRDEWLYGALREYLEQGKYAIYVAPIKKNEQANRIKEFCKKENFIYYNSTCLKFLPILIKTLNNSLHVHKIVEELKTIARESEQETIEKKKKKTREKKLAIQQNSEVPISKTA